MQTARRLDYPEALERLLGLVDYERIRNHPPAPPRPDLRRVEALLEKLGNPHQRAPLIHVAGTKGKGSTAALLTSALVALGHTCGLFTSPHLHTFRERIRLNREPVSEAVFASLTEACWPGMEAVNAEGSRGNVTLFELLGAMAFTLFAQEGCDWGVVEAGLGGRLDSTNVVLPAVAVITAISIDHAAILGSAIGEIAAEKAGIIKPGGRVVSGPQPPEALEVIRRTCEERGADLVYAPDRYAWERTSSDLDGQTFRVEGPQRSYDLWMPLLGFHQVENAAVAIAVLETLEAQGYALALGREAPAPAGEAGSASDGLVDGFRRVQWPARMEVLSRSPLVVVDGAHNAASLERLRESLREYLPYDDLVLVAGWGADKEGAAMAEVIARMAPRMVVEARSRHPRSMPRGGVAELLRGQGVPVAAAHETVAEAVRHGMQLAGPGDLVLATGSLFVAAETREAVLGIPSEVYPEFQATAGLGP